MLISAIICEYNPFHNGHKYQIDFLKNKNHNVIALMSGNFVQRGEPAIIKKEHRAKMAILAGADLVLELPLPYCLSCGERFAFNSVKILNSLGVIDFLCFGCEDNDIPKLYELAILLNDKITIDKIKGYKRKGLSYPLSLEHIIKEKFDEEYVSIIRKPNNILALEYIKALISLDSKINPLPLKRHLTGHHDTFNQNIASATFIRTQLSNNNVFDILNFVPENEIKNIYESVFKSEKYIDYNHFNENMIVYLKRLDSNYFKNILDVSSGFENKIVKEIKNSLNFDGLLKNLVDKTHTKALVKRVLLNAYLNIDKKTFDNFDGFIKVLGFNENGKEILKKAKLSSTIHFSHSLLKCNNSTIVDKTNLSTNLYNMSLQKKDISNTEFTEKIIKL
ncbi:MAG: tRNA(Met) cytidine acetate ligase [Oscillospiraceae bacterium]